MIFCTVARQSQFADAVALAKSVKTYHADAYFILCLVEHHAPAHHTKAFDEVLLINNNGISGSTWESNCAVKAYFLKHLLANCIHEGVIYLDPETRLYSPLEEVMGLLHTCDIIAVPYLTEPCDSHDYKWEIDRINNGFLYAGFLALRNSDTSRRFTHWWSSRVDASYYGPGSDPLADHKWLSLGMTPFQIHLLKEPGYQIAAWNLHESKRRIEWAGSGYAVGGKRLRTFSFSNPEGLLDQKLDALCPDGGHPARELCRSYKEGLEQTLRTLS